MTDTNSGKVPVLSRDLGFELWMVQMRIHLDLKSEAGMDLAKVFDAADGLTFHQRKKARGHILQGLCREDLMAVHEIANVPQIVEWLRRKYVGNVQSRMMSLMGEFGSIRMKRGQSVSELVEKVLKLARELDTVGQPQSETAIIASILNAMPKDFASTVERLVDREEDAMNPMTVERVRTSLLRKEHQLAEGTGPQLETKALLATEARAGDKRTSQQEPCWRCGHLGHWSRQCNAKKPRPGFTPKFPFDSPISAPGAGGRGDRGGRGGRDARQRIGGRGRHGRGRGGRPRALAIHEAEDKELPAAWGDEPLEQGDDGRITITLTPKQLEMLTYRGAGPSPHVAYTRPSADRTGDPTPVELAEMMRCILDSGAGVSVSPYLPALTEFIAFSKGVGCANDTYMPAHGSGTLSATSHQDGGSMHVDITNVWYVPACKHTLISVKQLQKQGCWAIIQDNWIQYYNSRNEKLFLAVETDLGFEIKWDLHVPVKHVSVHLLEREHGHRVHHATAQHNVLKRTAPHIPAASLPALLEQKPSASEGEPIEGVHVQYVTSETEGALLLHARTGHVAFATLAKMQEEGHITGSSVTVAQLREAAKHTCGICVQAKTARNPYKPSQRVTTRCLELVHSDLVEFPVTSLGGGKYVLVVTDDYSKWCGVKILKSKAHAKDELQSMLNQWMTITGQNVHTLRTDRGGEFVSADMKEYLSEKGIIHQQSIAYAHQQNGKAERANRSLTNTVRALLLQAKFPQYMWAEAMLLACHL
jgi:transposase InsO family protein